MKTATSSMLENMPKPMTEMSVAPRGEVAVGEDGEVEDGIVGHQLADQEARERAHGDDAIATIAVESNHSSRSPRSSTSCRHPKPDDHQAEAPPVDPRRACAETASRTGTRSASTKPTMPTGRLM